MEKRKFTTVDEDKIFCTRPCEGKNAFSHSGTDVCGVLRAPAKKGHQVDTRTPANEMRICTKLHPEK